MSELCGVCAAPLVRPSVASCNFCGSDYHFQTRQDLPAPDCGIAWIDDAAGYLLFACQTCVEAGRSTATDGAEVGG
jgi:hypothetical protein